MADTLYRFCTTCFLCLALFSLPCHAQSAAPAGDGAPDTPEVRALRATIDRQAKEILSLRAEIAALRAGKPSPATTIAPVSRVAPLMAATRPAARPGQPQRVIFLIDLDAFPATYVREWRPISEKVAEEVARATSELGPDDLFNVVYTRSTEKEAHPFRPRPVAATQANRQACYEDILHQQTPGLPGDAAVGLRAALKMEPSTVWFIASYRLRVPQPAADLLREVKLLNDPQRTGRPAATINTVLMSGSETDFLWSLAHDSGGVSIDLAGNDLPRPAAPPPPAPKGPPPLPSGPSILTPHN